MRKPLTCLIGMALPLPMLSVLLSTLFACSLAFRDCKKTRKSVSNWGGTLAAEQREGVVGSGGWRGSEVRFWGVVECVDVRWVRGGRRLHVRKGGEVRACVFEHFGEGAGRCKKKGTN